MNNPRNNVGMRQKIITALAFGATTDEVSACLNVSHEAVCNVADENAPLITHMMVDRTNRLAKEHDSKVRKR